MTIADGLNIPLCELMNFAVIQQPMSCNIQDNISKLLTEFDKKYLEMAFEQLYALYKLRK